MAYIGANPVNGFFEKQELTTDGSTTTFTLQTTVGSSSSILVSVGGVIQEPEVAYNLGAGGTTIIFTEAPASTADTYVHYLGQAIVQNVTDLNGTEMVLDVDADTSFTADTDDEIDIKVAGSDISTIKATGFHNLDSIKFIAGTGDGTLYGYDLKKNKIIYEAKIGTGSLTRIIPYGPYLLVGAAGSGLVILRARDGAPVQSYGLKGDWLNDFEIQNKIL